MSLLRCDLALRHPQWAHFGSKNIPRREVFEQTVSPKMFDRDFPSGSYSLDLADPLERSIAQQLFELAKVQEGENIVRERIDGLSCP